MTKPEYLLAASPAGVHRLKQFYNPTAGVAGLINNPPGTRPSGFGLTTVGGATLVNNEYWESRTDVRRLVHLYPDGTLIFRAAGDSRFLCWPPDESPQRVNPIVVCESALSFARFYQALIQMFVREPDTLIFRVELHSAMTDGQRLILPPGGIKGDDWQMANAAQFVNDPNPRAALNIGCEEIVSTPDHVAFSLAAAFYKFFDYSTSLDIPYAREVDGKPVIDATLFDKR